MKAIRRIIVLGPNTASIPSDGSYSEFAPPGGSFLDPTQAARVAYWFESWDDCIAFDSAARSLIPTADTASTITLAIPALYVGPLARLTAALRDNPSVLEAAKMDYATEVWTWLCDRLSELAKEQDAG